MEWGECVSPSVGQPTTHTYMYTHTCTKINTSKPPSVRLFVYLEGVRERGAAAAGHRLEARLGHGDGARRGQEHLQQGFVVGVVVVVMGGGCSVCWYGGAVVIWGPCVFGFMYIHAYIDATCVYRLPIDQPTKLMTDKRTCARSPWKVMRQILSRDLYASLSSESAAPLAAFMRFRAMEPGLVCLFWGSN